jgi:hypothetical protein
MEQALEIPPELLVGHWRTVHGLLTVDWIFHSNGSFAGTMKRRGKLISDFTGTWMLEGTWLHSEYTSDGCGAVDVGFTDRDVFLEFTCNYFVIQTRTGRRRYDRVQ